MRATFFNFATSLSIGVYFSLMIAGLAATLPSALFVIVFSLAIAMSLIGAVASLFRGTK